MATLKEALEYAKMNPNSSFATALRTKIENGEADEQAKAEGVQLPGRQQSPGFLDKVGSAVSERYGNIKNELTSNQVTSPTNLQASGMEKVLRVAGQAAGAVGDIIGAGIGSAASTVNEMTGGAAGEASKAGASYILNTDLGKQGLNFAQQGMEKYSEWKQANPNAAKDLEAVVNIASIIPIGKGAGVTLSGVEDVAKATTKGLTTAAKTVVEAPIVSGTGEVLKSAGRTLKTIPENIATNVGEMQAKEAVINSFPSTAGQNAIRKGVDIADATTLQNAIKTPEAKTLIETIKNYAAGNKSVSPFEVVGKPIVNRLKTLDTQVKSYATQLDSVAKDLKGVSLTDVSKIDTAVMDGLNKLQVGIKKGGLDFVGSSLEGIGSSGKIVDNVFKRLQEARDAFDLHNLKKYIDANVSYGKRVEGLDAGAERLLKTWRKAIDDTLDTQFIEYNKVNTELAKRISPLEDLKSILKNTDGLDTDLLSEKAGIIARRITSAAASNPEIKQVLRNLDQFTSTTGKTLGKIENLQDLYNTLNKYYDIAPKTGFQNLVKEGVNVGGGLTEQVIDKVKGFAGSTNATRQKALENYLDELLNPAKAKIPTKVMNSTKATTKNVIMPNTIPQSTKAATKVVEKSKANKK